MGRTIERKKSHHVVSCEVTKAMFNKLDEESKAKGRSKSETIRTALRDYLYTEK